MRISLISDIHGNLPALEGVLADIERRQVDQTICLGDVANLGPQPVEVVERLMELDFPTVMGNHDPFDEAPTILASIWEWTKSQLSPRHLEYLRSFPLTREIPLDADNHLLCFHGTPQSFNHNIFPITPEEDLAEIIGDTKAIVLACGHTHFQMTRRLHGRWVVNVGSVGMPFRDMPAPRAPRIFPWAEYAILDWQEGSLGVELRRVKYDVEAFRNAAQDWMVQGWIDQWITVEELRDKGLWPAGW